LLSQTAQIADEKAMSKPHLGHFLVFGSGGPGESVICNGGGSGNWLSSPHCPHFTTSPARVEAYSMTEPQPAHAHRHMVINPVWDMLGFSDIVIVDRGFFLPSSKPNFALICNGKMPDKCEFMRTEANRGEQRRVYAAFPRFALDRPPGIAGLPTCRTAGFQPASFLHQPTSKYFLK